MATQARFGRLPRAAPSLTSTIVALAQEYQRVRESNIVDAWKNGGMFEGKKVTDEMVMKWMKDRRNEMSPDDPKWDYYNNQLVQYEFAIANSKMELKYKRNDVSDSAMAAFYHKWADKLPPGSEAYREREKLAAGYADRAASGRAASGRASADKAYAASINADYKKGFTYDAMLTFLEGEAHDRGILKPDEGIGNIDPSTADGREINRLWDEIATAPEFKAHRDFYTAQIKAKGDPNFNGDFSQDAFNAQTPVKNAAVSNQIKTARKAGRQGDVTAFTKEKDGVAGTKILTGGFDETEQYEDARAEWIATFTNPNATRLEQDRATQKYTQRLTGIRDSLEKSTRVDQHDPRVGYIANELRTLSGDEAPLEHWGGAFGPGGNQGGAEATKTAQSIKRLQTDLANLSIRDETGQPMYVQVKTSDGGFTPAATTDRNHAFAMWGVVRRDQLPPEAIFVVQNDYGDPRAGGVVTAVMPTPIHAVNDVRDNATGAIEKKQVDTPMAYHYTLPDGKVGYKYRDAGGNWLYTPDNPFGTRITKPDGSSEVVPIKPEFAGGGNATIYSPNAGAGGRVAVGKSAQILEEYYNPNQNVAMTSRIGKSGYSLWLMASDPKDRAAYAQKPEDILASLRLEAGGDMKKLQDMVNDADARRAVYLGNSTEEQNRLRQNARNGVPSPVPLSSLMPKAGLTAPSAEQKKINEIIAGGGVVKPGVLQGPGINGAPLGGPAGLQGPGINGQPLGTVPEDPHSLMRKYGMVPSPPKPLGEPKVAPTSMGSDIPGQIAQGLGGFIAGIFGQQPKMTLPSVIGQSAGPIPGSQYNTAPKPTGAPKPAPAPPPVKPPTTPPPTPVSRQGVAKPPDAKGYTTVTDRYGNWAYKPDKGGKPILA